jgi:hypothetical protein
VYGEELQLMPTQPEQLARPVELPMTKEQLPKPEVAQGEQSRDPVSDLITTGSVKP